MSEIDDDAAAARRLNDLAERENDAPDWLRQVLRRMASNPAAYSLAKTEGERTINRFIYFH